MGRWVPVKFQFNRARREHGSVWISKLLGYLPVGEPRIFQRVFFEIKLDRSVRVEMSACAAKYRHINVLSWCQCVFYCNRFQSSRRGYSRSTTGRRQCLNRFIVKVEFFHPSFPAPPLHSSLQNTLPAHGQQ